MLVTDLRNLYLRLPTQLRQFDNRVLSEIEHLRLQEIAIYLNCTVIVSRLSTHMIDFFILILAFRISALLFLVGHRLQFQKLSILLVLYDTLIHNGMFKVHIDKTVLVLTIVLVPAIVLILAQHFATLIIYCYY